MLAISSATGGSPSEAAVMTYLYVLETCTQESFQCTVDRVKGSPLSVLVRQLCSTCFRWNANICEDDNDIEVRSHKEAPCIRS